jgi:hypothetical protein
VPPSILITQMPRGLGSPKKELSQNFEQYTTFPLRSTEADMPVLGRFSREIAEPSRRSNAAVQFIHSKDSDVAPDDSPLILRNLGGTEIYLLTLDSR